MDLACGTGVIARLVGPRLGPDGSVLALDASSNMIDYGRRLPSTVGAPVAWTCANAVAVPLDDATVDTVYCQQGLQFFSDPQRVLSEVRRVLAPNGRLALAVWRSLRDHPGFADLLDSLARHLPTTAVATLRAAFAGPDRSGIHDLLLTAGFAAVRVRIAVVEVRFPTTVHFLDAEIAGSPLADPVAALDPEARDRLAADVDRAMTPHNDDTGLVLPMQTWLVQAR